MATEAQRRAVKKYDAANTVQFHLKLNVNTDAAIIEKLKSVEKVQTYLKELIAADIKNQPLPYLVMEVVEITHGAECHTFMKYCPNCNVCFGDFYLPIYCPSCGQAIDKGHNGQIVGKRTIDRINGTVEVIDMRKIADS